MRRRSAAAPAQHSHNPIVRYFRFCCRRAGPVGAFLYAETELWQLA